MAGDHEPNSLFQVLAHPLAKAIYRLLPILHQLEQENLQDSKALKKGKNAKKTSKLDQLQPALIKAMESYESSLLQLGTKRACWLVDHFYRSTARDFRIRVNELMAMLEEQDEHEDDGERVDGDGDENEDERRDEEQSGESPLLEEEEEEDDESPLL